MGGPVGGQGGQGDNGRGVGTNGTGGWYRLEGHCSLQIGTFTSTKMAASCKHHA